MTITADDLLKIWAVLGPLLAGAASALWARHIQLQDRAHEKELAEKARSYSIEDSAITHKRIIIKEESVELNAALSNFISAVHEYVAIIAVEKSDATDERKYARRRLNDSFSVVSLLGDEEMHSSACELIGAATSLPGSGSDDNVFGDEESSRFHGAKRDFLGRARAVAMSAREA